MGPRPACGERAAWWFSGKEWVRGNSAGERPSPITVCGTAREPSPRKRGEGSFGAGAHLRSRSTELELHGGWFRHVFCDRECLHGLVAAVEGGSPDHAGKGAQLRVVLAHRLDVVAPCHRDAILGAFELRLECKKVLVRFEVG